LEYESACDALCDNITTVLLAMGRPTRRATFVAARATHQLADALHHAAGTPTDPRWSDALGSLSEFVDVAGVWPTATANPAFASLREFLEENAA
jgi:hypothetical protein